MEAAPRFELGVKDLQSSALPLGYTALLRWIILIIVCYLVKIEIYLIHFFLDALTFLAAFEIFAFTVSTTSDF